MSELHIIPDQPPGPRPTGPLPLLQALNQAAVSLRWSALTTAEVFQAVTKQISALDLQGNIGLIDEDQVHMTFAAMAFSREAADRLTKIIGPPKEGFRCKYKNVDDFRHAVEARSPVYTDDNSKAVAQSLPPVLSAVMGIIVKIIGGTRGICAPLIAGGRVLGLLIVIGKELRPEDTAIMEAFANHIAMALENARLFESMQSTQRELLLAKATAEKASQVKSEFLAIMSHELRTPLTSIIGFTELLIEEKACRDDVRAGETFQTILNNGKHLLQMINGVLDLVTIESGQLNVRLQPVDVSSVIDELLAAAPVLLKNKPVRLVKTIAPKFPGVETDRTMLKQILFNLLGNAIKFTERGEIYVEAVLENHDSSQFTIRVRDTGAGIPADKLALIFQPFQQAHGGNKRHYGGSGIGLSIARALAETLGGRISVESAVGKGSVFAVTLPIAPAISAQNPAGSREPLPEA